VLPPKERESVFQEWLNGRYFLKDFNYSMRQLNGGWAELVRRTPYHKIVVKLNPTWTHDSNPLNFEVDISLLNSPSGDDGFPFSQMKVKCTANTVKTSLGILDLSVKSRPTSPPTTTTTTTTTTLTSTSTTRRVARLDFAQLPPELQETFLDYLDELRVNNLLAKFVKEYFIKCAQRRQYLLKTSKDS